TNNFQGIFGLDPQSLFASDDSSDESRCSSRKSTLSYASGRKWKSALIAHSKKILRRGRSFDESLRVSSSDDDTSQCSYKDLWTFSASEESCSECDSYSPHFASANEPLVLDVP